MAYTKTLYIPLEIIDRELGGALLMAVEAISRGWTVVLGGKQAIFNNMSRFSDSPGIFFLKSVVPGEVFKQKEIAAFGHAVVSLDVEGLVPSNGKAGVCLRYSDESIQLSDLLFFWGREHYEAVCSVYPQIKELARISGSPIIDEVKVRGAKFIKGENVQKKKKILIGTSCGYANHINGISFSKEMTRNAYGKNVSEDDIFALEMEAELDQQIFEYWKKVLPLIAKSFPDSDIVLRPHPSENSNFWREYLKIYTNVRVDVGQPILEELLDAAVYLHFNSTSAITSTILNIPTLMPMPSMPQALRDRVTYVAKISKLAKTESELLYFLNEFVNESNHILPSKDLSAYCENLQQGSESASKLILNELEKKYKFGLRALALKSRTFDESVIVSFRKVKYFTLWVGAIFFNVCGYQPKRLFPPLNAYKSAKSKQPKTSLAKVYSEMSKLMEMSTIESLDCKSIATNLFIIRGKKVHERTKI
ncbi:MAG: hypothetical protein P8N92_01350 [Burkholderiales bacterium]|nr:hypothetical protein [Burkholderiales bacterium]